MAAVTCFAASALHAATIVDDDFSDGDLTKTGLLDANWWTSSSSSGIEVSPGSLGLVTGTSGRGIHTVFPTQTLSNIGDKLTATYTFTTPATIAPNIDGSDKAAAFRVGLFDTLGRGDLDANVDASSSDPNSVYGLAGTSDGLPGYFMDMDVATGSEDLNFRRHDIGSASGRLMATSTGFSSISPSGPDAAYTFAADTEYTGTLMITRVSATEVEIAGSLGGATHSVTDAFDSDSFGFLGFHVNSRVFGANSSAGDPDNGIDFSRITIEFTNGVPEPSSLLLLVGGLIGLPRMTRRGIKRC